jgi:hypothetical protein
MAAKPWAKKASSEASAFDIRLKPRVRPLPDIREVKADLVSLEANA